MLKYCSLSKQIKKAFENNLHFLIKICEGSKSLSAL